MLCAHVLFQGTDFPTATGQVQSYRNVQRVKGQIVLMPEAQLYWSQESSKLQGLEKSNAESRRRLEEQ
ncbi:hypothetical protein N7540_013175 [Penicillium herquei]|nr:hypothetical protein N7540_013175 [Penicillium herquei]